MSFKALLNSHLVCSSLLLSFKLVVDTVTHEPHCTVQVVLDGGHAQGWGCTEEEVGHAWWGQQQGRGGRGGEQGGAVSSRAQLQGGECWKPSGEGWGSGNRQGAGSCLPGAGVQRVSRGWWEPWWVRNRADG